MKFNLKPDVHVAGRDFLSTDALADQTGTAKKTLEIHRSKGKGCRYFKLANRCLYDLEDVNQYLETLFVRPAGK